jgi:hypothetical protein
MNFETHPQHDHFFVEDETLMESYKTNRGLRSTPVLPLPDHPDVDHCTIEYLNTIEAFQK